LKISILMPVYNAAEFVRQAVESALTQPETGEVILVEDASTDASLEACRALEAQYPAVHLFRHPDGRNHGEAASRNLAIARSTCDYIACLDADDYYLPDRFSREREFFTSDPGIEGVYGALGQYIENGTAQERWKAANPVMGKMTTMDTPVPPEQLYETLILGKHGYFHLNSTTVNRSVFQKTGPFNEKLKLHTDMDMQWKMAAVARLVPGKLAEPVAMRRIHEHNTISAPRSQADIYQTRLLLYREAWRWARKNLKPAKSQVLIQRYLMYAETTRLKQASSSRSLKFQRKMWLLAALFKDLPLIGQPYFWWRFLPKRFIPAALAAE
jgi:glycosyltransferase involved in cell wall biosynthesis